MKLKTTKNTIMFCDYFKALKNIYDDMANFNKYPLSELCLFTQRNINMFLFGIDGGGSNNSYVDIIKIAIRRQIDLNQKITGYLMNAEPIEESLKKEYKSKDYDGITKYWKDNYNFLDIKVDKIKKDASNYVHPKYLIKPKETKNIKELALYIYETCGGKDATIDHFLTRLSCAKEEAATIKKEVIKLSSQDLINMWCFCSLFQLLVKDFNIQKLAKKQAALV